MKHLLVGALVGGLLLGRPAAAQDLGGALDIPQLANGLALSAAIRADAERRAAEKGIKLDDAATSSSTRASSAARLTYTPTPALRQQTVQRLAQRLQARSPAQAQALRTAFGPGKPDYGQLYTAALRGSGFRDNDAASALAAYLEMSYVVVNSIQDTRAITPAVDRGLRSQVAGMVSQNPAARNPAQLAQLGEDLKLQTVLLASGWQASLKSGQSAAFSANIARQFTAQYGFDLTQVKLTERGFTKK